VIFVLLFETILSFTLYGVTNPVTEVTNPVTQEESLTYREGGQPGNRRQNGAKKGKQLT
jgi:hypothetical protein